MLYIVYIQKKQEWSQNGTLGDSTFFLYKQYFILFQKLAIAPKATKGLTGALLTLHIYKKNS
jgi:hypothetical protein